PIPSARRPLLTVVPSTFAPYNTPKAKNTPVLSTMKIITTRAIVRIAAISNVGTQKRNGVGNENHEADLTSDGSTRPKNEAKIVPTTKATKIAIDFKKPFA